MRLLPRSRSALPVAAEDVTEIIESHAGVRPTPASAPDGLGTRLARRDRSALTELYDACAGRAFGLAFRVLNNGPAAEDAVHDAFLWLWEHADRVDPRRGAVESLLLTVTHRRAIDSLRRRTRDDRHREQGPSTDDGPDDEALALLASIDGESTRVRLRSALADLNQDQREAIDLAFFAGMTHREIAAARQLPVGTVKSRLRLAMGRLRAALMAEEP